MVNLTVEDFSADTFGTVKHKKALQWALGRLTNEIQA